MSLKKIIRKPGVSKSAVLYPMAGFDSFTPLVLFPESSVYILIDNNSVMTKSDFVLAKKNGVDVSDFHGNSAWIHYSQTGVGLFTKLLASIRAVHPENKITDVRIIHDKALDTYSAIIDFYDFKAKSFKKIYFCSGEIDHLEGTFMNPNYRPWWESVLSYYQPRNILLKGSESELRLTRHEDSASRQKIFQHLKGLGGVLVEGAGRANTTGDLPWSYSLDSTRPKWEGSDGDSDLSSEKALQEVIINDIQFSYSNKVRISSY